MAKREPPPQEALDVRGLAQRYTRAALRTLAEIMERGASEQARIAAADRLLDRAHGKPRADADNLAGKSFEDLVREAAEEDGDAGT